MSALDDAWSQLPSNEQERLHRYARRSMLQLDAYPYDDVTLIAELDAWVDLDVEVTTAHTDWIHRTHAELTALGVDFTLAAINQHQDGTTE